MMFLLGYIAGLVTMFIVVSYYLNQASNGKLSEKFDIKQDNK